MSIESSKDIVCYDNNSRTIHQTVACTVTEEGQLVNKLCGGKMQTRNVQPFSSICNSKFEEKNLNEFSDHRYFLFVCISFLCIHLHQAREK